MAVELGDDELLEDGQHVLDQPRPASDPLEVRALAVVVGPIEPRAGKPRDEPAHERLVADVLAQDDVRLLAVATERSLAHEHAGDEPTLDVGQHPRIVTPGRKT